MNVAEASPAHVRLCVLGNSHVAALKHGWARLQAAHPGLTLDFFAAPRDGMAGLRLQGDALVPADDTLAAALAYTSGGMTSVEIHRYDGFLIHALGFRLPMLARPLSRAVAVATCGDRFDASQCGRLASLVRQRTSRPVHVGCIPLRAEPQVAQAVAASVSPAQAAARTSEALQARALEFLPQPAASIGPAWNTLPAYSKGAMALMADRPHADGDTLHMNGLYGEQVLQALFQQLGFAAPAQAELLQA